LFTAIRRWNMGDSFNPFKSSIPLPGGGDTHIHPFGPNPTDFTITTSIPIRDGIGTLKIHENPLAPHDPKINNIKGTSKNTRINVDKFAC
jgi:hypothetical protein